MVPSSPSENPVLRVENLSKDFVIGRWRNRRSIHAVNAVNLEVFPSEIVALVGESGSGKTTLATLIAHLYVPTSGTIVIDGQAYPPNINRKQTLKLRKNVQMVFQDPYASLNNMHNVRYILSRPLHDSSLGRRHSHSQAHRKFSCSVRSLAGCGLP